MKNMHPWVITALILLAAFSRLIPHPPNFTALSAIGLCAGVYFANQHLAYVLVFVSMLLSDLFLGFHSLVPLVYTSLFLSIWLAHRYGRTQTYRRLPFLAISSSVAFFVITNLGVWVTSGMYPHTPQGLTQCFIAAVPFFQNQLAGDLFYTVILFGVPQLLRIYEKHAPLFKAR